MPEYVFIKQLEKKDIVEVARELIRNGDVQTTDFPNVCNLVIRVVDHLGWLGYDIVKPS